MGSDAPDPRTDDELRACLRDAEGPDRVAAAFELGLRLGAAAIPSLSLEQEASSGVRRHLLTVLASFGERDAVLAVAEGRAGTAEGEHALHLAVQLGLVGPAWLADRFRDGSARLRAELVGWDAVDWAALVPELERLLSEDREDVRKKAAERLLGLQPAPGEALRAYGLAFPAVAGEVLEAWARGPEHAALATALPVLVGWQDVGLEALVDAGRRYGLEVLQDVVVGQPEAFDLVQGPVDRGLLWSVTDRRVGLGMFLPASWVAAVGETLAAPWSAAEEGMLARWAEEAAVWREDAADEGWVEDEPGAVQVVNVLGCGE